MFLRTRRLFFAAEKCFSYANDYGSVYILLSAFVARFTLLHFFPGSLRFQGNINIFRSTFFFEVINSKKNNLMRVEIYALRPPKLKKCVYRSHTASISKM